MQLKKTTPLLILLITLLIIQTTTAIQPTQQTNTIYMTPYYLASITSGTNQNFKIEINPPDGLTKIEHAILNFHAYILPTVTYTLKVNNQTCNTPTYTVSTTQASAGMADVSFDCTNIINKIGNYTATLTANKNTGATTSTLQLTYTNNPHAGITVHGTEYEAGQQAKVWLQLLNNTGDAIENGVCYVDIYTPDNEEYLERATMTNMQHDGIYYYDLNAPLIEGVYPVIARCYYEASTTPYFPNGNYSMTVGIATDTTQSKIYSIDNSFWRFNEDASAGKRRLNFTIDVGQAQNCTSVSEQFLTGITMSSTARFNSVVNDNIHFQIFNWTSQTWISLPNYQPEGATWTTITNSISLNNITKSGLLNTTTNLFKLRITDTDITDAGDNNLDIDRLYVGCDQLANPTWQEVKGSSEIHINPQTTGLGNPFFSYTLCGNSNVESLSSACEQTRFGNYTSPNNPDGFAEPQGWLYENITVINNRQTNVESNLIYETPLGVDCTAILDIIEERSTTTTDLQDLISLESGIYLDNCRMTIPINFNQSENDINIVIIQDNFMLWEINRAKRLINFYREPIQTYCDQLASNQEINLTVPIITNLTQYENNTLLTTCWQSLDDLYWFDDYETLSRTYNTSGLLASSLAGIKYYLPLILNSLETVNAIKNQNIPLFTVDTICEKEGIPSAPDSFTCQILNPPDNYFPNREGWILANLTFHNTYNTHTLETFNFQTGKDIDCSAILDVLRIDQNGTTTDIYDLTALSGGNEGNCILTLPIHFQPEQQQFDIIIKQENYIHWNMNQMKDKIYSVRNNTQTFCDNLLQQQNITFTFPINASIDNYSDPQVRFCLGALDDLYWFDFFDTQHQQQHNQTHYLFQVLQSYDEFLYFYPFIMEEFDIIDTFRRKQTQETTLTLTQYLINQTNQINLTSQYILNQTNQLINITTDNQNLLTQIWNYLTNYINNLLLNINSTVTNNSINIAILLNQTNTTSQPALIIATTNACITDSTWTIDAQVYDQYNTNYPIATCLINTTIYGQDTMTYNPNTTTYHYENTCPPPTNWTWAITCT